MARRKDFSPDKIAKLLRGFSESELCGSNLYFDEDIIFSEINCKESDEKTDITDYIPVNPDIYMDKDGTELIPHYSKVPDGCATRNVLRQSSARNIMLTKNRRNAGSFTITNQKVSNSECGPVVISRLWQRFQRTGDVTRQPVPGRPRVTTPRQDRYLVISARRQRSSIDRALGSVLTAATGIRISRQTVYRRLNHAGLYARRPAVCIPLTPAHKRARLNGSLKKHWSVGEWANVMFSDESQFSLSSDSRRVTIWRECGTRFEPRNITESHDFPSRGVMTAQRYRDEVLEPYVSQFRGAVDPDFKFMDDNAPCHRVVLIDDFLETENIQRMSWPANSPDLIPIEHVYARETNCSPFAPTKLCFRAEESSPKNLEPIEPTTYSSCHIASMVNHCEACLAGRGDYTPY
ncbi:transposable element Tcb2 transposase [Trichonephila clavipes]|nr:transposable element Tcb2 transposase [Trichonephila clavipes]